MLDASHHSEFVGVYKALYQCSHEEALNVFAHQPDLMSAVNARERLGEPNKVQPNAKGPFSMKLFEPRLGGTVITYTDYIEYNVNVKSRDCSILDSPLTPEVFVHIYRVFLKLAFQYVKTAKNVVYRVVWGNFNCMIPPWKFRYESGDANAADILSKSSDIFKRESLFFPFFEDSGWSWLLVVRLAVAGKLEMSVYDFSSGENKAIRGAIQTVVKFLQESWSFFNPGQKMPSNLNDNKFQIKMETDTHTDVTMSGWVMLHVLECLAISSRYPQDIKTGVMDMREWLRTALLSPDDTVVTLTIEKLAQMELISFRPEQLVRLSQLAGCDLK